jgi:hypothetical protein
LQDADDDDDDDDTQQDNDDDDDGNADDGFGDDFDDFEEGNEDDDFDDFEDGFQEAETPAPTATRPPQQSTLPFVRYTYVMPLTLCSPLCSPYPILMDSIQKQSYLPWNLSSPLYTPQKNSIFPHSLLSPRIQCSSQQGPHLYGHSW